MFSNVEVSIFIGGFPETRAVGGGAPVVGGGVDAGSGIPLVFSFLLPLPAKARVLCLVPVIRLSVPAADGGHHMVFRP